MIEFLAVLAIGANAFVIYKLLEFLKTQDVKNDVSALRAGVEQLKSHFN